MPNWAGLNRVAVYLPFPFIYRTERGIASLLHVAGPRSSRPSFCFGIEAC